MHIKLAGILSSVLLMAEAKYLIETLINSNQRVSWGLAHPRADPQSVASPCPRSNCSDIIALPQSLPPRASTTRRNAGTRHSSVYWRVAVANLRSSLVRPLSRVTQLPSATRPQRASRFPEQLSAASVATYTPQTSVQGICIPCPPGSPLILTQTETTV